MPRYSRHILKVLRYLVNRERKPEKWGYIENWYGCYMNIDYDKIRNLLERVTSGNAGVVELEYDPNMETCTITWKRPKSVSVHKSWKSRIDMLLYVKSLLVDMGIGVNINVEVTQEDFLPED